jgi:NADH:ubiquinone oxidoreductase subunit 3 (subunit A)
MDGELRTFYPIFLYLLVILAFAGGTLAASHWVAPRRRTAVKDMPYESGMDPIGDARQHFDVKYYLVAILFLVFDVELLFLYPWAVSAYATDSANSPVMPVALQNVIFGVMLSFLTTLALAYIYAWRKGVFKWR